MKVLTALDWAMVAAYFLLVFIVAMAVSRKSATRESAEGYFLSNRNAGWFIVGSSLFASNIGAEHLVGLAGSGAAGGVAVGQFEILASLILLLLGWFFVPFYLKSGVFTMPEFLERRYSPAARWYLAVISIVGYVLTKISVTIFAGGIVFEALMGLDFWTGAVIVVVATGVYTVFGGLRAVLYTDMLQAFVFVGGSAVVLFIGLDAVGGWSGLYAGRRQHVLRHVETGDRPELPVDRHPARRADPRRLVLVHGPVHRPARAGGEKRRQRPARRDLRRLSQGAAALHLRDPRRHRPRARLDAGSSRWHRRTRHCRR